MRILISLVVAATMLGGCSGTIPVKYDTQSFVTVNGGEASMGEFTYEPADSGVVKPNQLQNTAAGAIYIGEDVAKYVQRATALELQNVGVTVDESVPIAVEGNIRKFELDDFGYSVDWSYSVTYTVLNRQSGKPLFEKTYTPQPRVTGKFGNPSDYTSSINLIILDAIEAFLKDIKREQLFGV